MRLSEKPKMYISVPNRRMAYVRYIVTVVLGFSAMFANFIPTVSAATLDVLTWPTSGIVPYVQERIKDFEATHPGVKVRLFTPPDYIQTILIESAAGIKRDVYLMGSIIDRTVRDILAQGLTRDLMPFLKKDKDIAFEDFYPPLMEAFTYKGRLVGLPMQVDTQATYINRTIFDECGIPIPSDGWDWDDMLKIARRTTKDANNDGIPEQWGFASDGYGLHYLGASTFLWANGGDIVDRAKTHYTLDQPEAIQALQYYYDLHFTHKVAVRPSDGLQWVRFWEGKVAIWESMSWNIAGNRQNAKDIDWDLVASLRSPRTGKAAPIISGGAVAISSTSTNPELAWEFIKFMFLSDDGQQRLAKLGRLPSRMKFGNFYVKNMGRPPANIRPVLENAMHGGRTPVWFEDPKVNKDVWNIVEQGWGEVMSQKKSVYNFVQATKPLVDAILK